MVESFAAQEIARGFGVIRWHVLLAELHESRKPGKGCRLWRGEPLCHSIAYHIVLLYYCLMQAIALCHSIVLCVKVA